MHTFGDNRPAVYRNAPHFRFASILLLVVGSVWLSPHPVSAWQVAPTDSNQCIQCHLSDSGRLPEPAQSYTDDIHGQRGLFCQDCHGGDPLIAGKDAAHAPATGYRGKPERRDIPEFCNRCHGDENFMKRYNPNIRVDQYTRYLTSVHGERLVAGDTKVAVCTSCHQVHQTRSKRDIQAWVYPTRVAATCGRCHADADYMADYDIAVNQVADYQASIHYKYLVERGDMTAPTCNDCHGNHGAVPPGVQSVHYVCGTCHASNDIQFQNSTHAEYFEMLDEPGCITCHANHQTVRVEEEGLELGNETYCGTCHEADEFDDGGMVIVNVKMHLDSLRTGLEDMDSLIHLVETKGMDVSEARFLLSQTRTVLTKSRNVVHSFSGEIILESANEGLTMVEEVRDAGFAALREIRTRRIGLAVSLLLIAGLCWGLYRKIQQYPIPPQ